MYDISIYKAKDEYKSIEVPEGAILLFRNFFHFGRTHKGSRFLLFFYLDYVNSGFQRRLDQTFHWGDALHQKHVCDHPSMSQENKDCFLSQLTRK